MSLELLPGPVTGYLGLLESSLSHMHLGELRGTLFFHNWAPGYVESSVMGSWTSGELRELDDPTHGCSLEPTLLGHESKGHSQHFWNGSVIYCFLHTYMKRLRMNSPKKCSQTVPLCTTPHANGLSTPVTSLTCWIHMAHTAPWDFFLMAPKHASGRHMLHFCCLPFSKEY